MFFLHPQYYKCDVTIFLFKKQSLILIYQPYFPYYQMENLIATILQLMIHVEAVLASQSSFSEFYLRNFLAQGYTILFYSNYCC